MPENEEQQNENEENFSAELAAEQDLYATQKRIDDLYEEGQSYGHPSYLKYSFLFALAGIIDLVDLLDVTGVGMIVSKIVSFLLTIGIFVTLWVTDTKHKKAQEYIEGLEEKISHLQLAVVRTSRRTMAVSKFLRATKMPMGKKVGREIARGMVKIRRLARKNPATKVLIGGALNMIPFLSILNIMIVWIYFVYRDEKKTFQTAKEASEAAT